MLVFEAIDGGFLSTIQDHGRKGYLRYGVPHSGAIDPFAHRVSNILLGNPSDSATIEVTLPGARFKVLTDTIVAVTGADLGCELNNVRMEPWQPFPVPAGGILSFTSSHSGMRSYIAIVGGFETPLVLGSRATYTRAKLGGLSGRKLYMGDRLSSRVTEMPENISAFRCPQELIPTQSSHLELRVVLGPQDAYFTADGVETFLTASYRITDHADRTGYRLSGPPIAHKEGADILSDGNPLGAVQIAGDGMPMVLLADRGTTGGYTKIATVIGVDVPKLAQACPGDQVTFKEVGLDEAHSLHALQEYAVAAITQTTPVVYGRRRLRMRIGAVDQEVVTSFLDLSASIDEDDIHLAATAWLAERE